MTDENFLSQEDIDALMDGMGAEESSSESSVDATGAGASASTGGAGGGDDFGQHDVVQGGGDGFDPEQIRPAFEIILRQASTVVSTVLNKNTEMSMNTLNNISGSSVWGSSEQFKMESICVKASFSSGLSGNLYVVVSHRDTAKLADLMMMGDGTADYEEDHKDALAELINQVMGAVCTAMGTEYGISINTDQVMIEAYEENNLPFSTDSGVQLNGTMSIEDFDDSEILLLADHQLATSLAANYSNTTSPEMGQVETRSAEGSFNDDLGNVAQEVQGAGQAMYKSTGDNNIDMLMDVPLDVSIELGRSDVSIRKVLELGPGSIVELDKKASEPVDLMVNDKLVAKGEVVVVDEYFGIRIVSLVSPEERIKHLR